MKPFYGKKMVALYVVFGGDSPLSIGTAKADLHHQGLPCCGTRHCVRRIRSGRQHGLVDSLARLSNEQGVMSGVNISPSYIVSNASEATCYRSLN